MHLDLPDHVTEQRERIATFVRDVVVPREPGLFAQCSDADRLQLQEAAKAAGVFAPQLPTHLGGRLRPDAVGCPARGGGHVAARTAGAELRLARRGQPQHARADRRRGQKERYLAPLASGAVRSCFAMTEPAPGVGSDPRGVRTRPVRTTGGWLLSGQKHFITGGEGAAFAIVMAATGAQPGEGVTMFLLPTSSDGWTLTGHYGTLDTVGVGGHCSFDLTEAFVHDEDVLGEVGQGFRYAQVRLAPARLTHRMRWLGAARRAHEVALARAVDREVFGRRLTDQGLAQALIADKEIDLVASRALLRQACWDVQHDRDPASPRRERRSSSARP